MKITKSIMDFFTKEIPLAFKEVFFSEWDSVKKMSLKDWISVITVDDVLMGLWCLIICFIGICAAISIKDFVSVAWSVAVILFTVLWFVACLKNKAYFFFWDKGYEEVLKNKELKKIDKE